jgi:hypothetical protein
VSSIANGWHPNTPKLPSGYILSSRHTPSTAIRTATSDCVPSRVSRASPQSRCVYIRFNFRVGDTTELPFISCIPEVAAANLCSSTVLNVQAVRSTTGEFEMFHMVSRKSINSKIYQNGLMPYVSRGQTCGCCIDMTLVHILCHSYSIDHIHPE